MNAIDRGSKHVCPDCATKYYDLNRETVACPKCGAKPPERKLRSSAQSGARSGTRKFGRFP